ncbi:hypothetical protein HPP92_003333, partial [Vanilla planifolia]
MANPRAMPHASMYRVVYAEVVGMYELGACPEQEFAILKDVPYLFNLSWMANSRLKDVVQQFKEHLQKLQAFWSTLESIDKSLVIINPKRPSLASSYRQICL